MKKCFDAEKYLKIQKKKIRGRIRMFDKLYIEFGGKLIDDQHAARTLPGFLPDLKIRLLQEFKDDAEIILCINANAIEKSKIRADHMISYETEVIRLIEFLRAKNLYVSSVVITLLMVRKKPKILPTNSKITKSKFISILSPKATPLMLTLLFPMQAMVPTPMSKPPNLSSSSRLPVHAPASSLLLCLSSTTNPNAASKLAMPNSKPSQSGLYRSNIPSTSPTKPPLPTLATST